jgi:hypothetical protein
MQKKEYCKKHGYKIIYVPYWEENKLSYEYLMYKAGY